MKIMTLGINYSTKKLLIDPVDEQSLGNAIMNSLGGNAALLRNLTQAVTLGVTFRGEVKRKIEDLADPHTAGWTFLVNSKDHNKAHLVKSIRRLAEHRGMKDPAEPLLFNGETADEWVDWLMENYSSPQMEQKPHYILILGGPDQVPFLFQSVLDTTAAVGRLAFDTPEELEAYADKVIKMETATAPIVNREAVFFAPDGGPSDPTYLSHHYLAKPLAKDMQGRLGFNVKTMFADDATKANLQDALRQTKPALVFTASHGLGSPDEPLETQKRINGAICCQQVGAMQDNDWLFSGEDIPLDEPFLEGAVFFQFACFGYGTLAESDFAHWDPRIGSKVNAKADFVAAFPKKLLSHPRGPIAFVGHVDIALVHGFDDPNNPIPMEGPWNLRIEPFKRSLDQMLGVNPMGIAMEDMNMRYNLLNAYLTGLYDRLQRGKVKVNADFQERLVSNFLMRSDAQNYMIFGDPAAHLRIPE
jgi:hypothetical protein